MKRQFIVGKPALLFAIGILATLISSSVASVQAESPLRPVQPGIRTPGKATKLTKVQELKALNLKSDGKPFLPSTLGQSESPVEDRAILGFDDRLPVLSRKYPWSAIGRLRLVDMNGSDIAHCTGTLIAVDVVLTNAHCVVDPKTRQVRQAALYFQPNLIDGILTNPADEAFAVEAVYGTDFPNGSNQADSNDWAVLKLNQPLGRKYGYLGWKSLASSALIKNPKLLSLIGYSGDFPTESIAKKMKLTAGPGLTPGVHQKCSVVAEKAELLLHNCDTTGGASGGPIIGWINNKPYVVALHAGGFDSQNNYAVKMSRLQELMMKRR